MEPIFELRRRALLYLPGNQRKAGEPTFLENPVIHSVNIHWTPMCQALCYTVGIQQWTRLGWPWTLRAQWRKARHQLVPWPGALTVALLIFLISGQFRSLIHPTFILSTPVLSLSWGLVGGGHHEQLLIQEESLIQENDKHTEGTYKSKQYTEFQHSVPD